MKQTHLRSIRMAPARKGGSGEGRKEGRGKRIGEDLEKVEFSFTIGRNVD